MPRFRASARGWGGIADSLRRPQASAMSFLRVSRSMSAPDIADEDSLGAFGVDLGDSARASSRRPYVSELAEARSRRASHSFWDSAVSRLEAMRPSAHSSTPSPLHRLVALQHADGSWDLTSEFAAAIGCDLAQLEAALTGVIGDLDEARRACATALALAWLETHADGDRDQWSRLAVKAQAWLSAVTARMPDGRGWAEAGTRLLP